MAEIRTAQGRRIAYDVTGNGPALLLLMGAGEARRLWARQVTAFASAYQVITMDNRDAGASNPEPNGYEVADLAGDVVALLDALGIARTHVLGTSLGSMIGLQLALDYPERVGRLSLLVPPAGGLRIPPPPREGWSDDHADLMRAIFPLLAAPGAFDASEGALEAVVALGRENRLTYDGLVRQLAAMERFDVRRRLPGIAAPTLLVAGEQDPLIPLADVQAVAAAMPDAHVVRIAGAGHLAFLERADAVNEAVLGFLKEAERRT